MVHKTVKLADKRTATLDWLRKTDLTEVMGALNSVIREARYLFMNTEITDMDEEQQWYERGIKEGMRYLVARVEGKVIGGASFHLHAETCSRG